MPRSSGSLDHSLPRSERIRKRADYVRIQGSGRKLSTPYFLALVVPSAQPLTRVGITVSKRVGNAVVRSRVKRLLREAFRLHKHRLRPGLDLVLLARPEAASASYSQIAQAMLDVCERLNRWRG